MQLAPYAFEAAGNVMGGNAAARAGNQNAAALQAQAQVASAQATADEETQRRQAALFFGEQAASLAQAGGGATGTAGKLVQQSEIFANLDALNIRYQGALRRSGLLAQARAAKEEGANVRSQSYMTAGTALLKGVGKGYEAGLFK